MPEEHTQQELQDAIDFRNKIWNKRKEIIASLPSCTNSIERAKQQVRAKALMGMYKDAAEEVRRLKLYFSNKKQVNTNKARSSDVDMVMLLGDVWADFSGHTWGEMSGYTWGREKIIQEDELQSPVLKYMRDVIKQGVTKCTELQKSYLYQYYGLGNTLREIGDSKGVNQSTVQRSIIRGLQHIRDYASAKLLIHKCIDNKGYFDYILFANSCNILTERQKEILYLVLATNDNRKIIGKFINRDKSVVSRNISRMTKRLSGLTIDVDREYSSLKVKKVMLNQVDEKQLAEDLGLSPKFYYCIIKGNRRVQDDITLLQYVVWKEIVQKPTARNKQIASSIGCSEVLVDKVRKRFKGKPFPNIPIPEYNRKIPKKVKLPENPYAALSEEFLIKSINKDTMKQIEKLREGL